MTHVRSSLLVLSFLVAANSAAATLPGFRIDMLGAANGFVSSIATDSTGRIYYTTTAGDLIRFDGGANTRVAHVQTVGISNAGLLGMAMIDDRTAAVHYTTSGDSPDAITSDVISRIDLTTGAETVLARFVCDVDVPQRGTSPEHHGGNPAIGADGSIFVAIGDYGGGAIAALPRWNGGKVWRIYPDGHTVQLAMGVRNPFDLVPDEAQHRVIVPDNGPAIGDQINVVADDGGPEQNFGWPYTFGTYATPDGIAPPVYIFEKTVAPTGITALRGGNDFMRSGLLLTAFVTKAIYYIPDVDTAPLPDPIAIVSGETSGLIDVTETVQGDIYFASGAALYRLMMPKAGDCNGDGLVDAADLAALDAELADAPERTIDAQNGAFRGSWGCDANLDGRIDEADRRELMRMLSIRRRSARAGR